jgi:methionyl-tRNA synthetase
MSKSIGNVVDPVEVISQYGTDALRFTLATGELPGSLQQQLLLSPLTTCVGMYKLNKLGSLSNSAHESGDALLNGLVGML